MLYSCVCVFIMCVYSCVYEVSSDDMLLQRELDMLLQRGLLHCSVLHDRRNSTVADMPSNTWCIHVCVFTCVYSCVCMKYPRMTCYFKGSLTCYFKGGSCIVPSFTTGEVAPSVKCLRPHAVFMCVCIHVCIFMCMYEVSSDDMLLQRVRCRDPGFPVDVQHKCDATHPKMTVTRDVLQT